MAAAIFFGVSNTYFTSLKDFSIEKPCDINTSITNAAPRNREVEIERVHSRAAKRFGTGDN